MTNSRRYARANLLAIAKEPARRAVVPHYEFTLESRVKVVRGSNQRERRREKRRVLWSQGAAARFFEPFVPRREIDGTYIYYRPTEDHLTYASPCL